MGHDATHSALKETIRRLESELAACRKRQAALEASEDKYRCLLNSQKDAVFVHPLKSQGFSNFIEVNEVACERYGYSKAEFMALSAMDITLRYDAQGHARPDTRSKLAQQGHMVFETVHITRSGHQFPVEISSNITEIGGKKVILAVVRDISERKAAEEALKKSRDAQKASEQRYQIVSELTSDYSYAFRVETDGEIINEWVTGAFHKLTGYSQEDLRAIGGWEALILKEDIPIAMGQLKSLMAGESASVEYRIVTQGGEIRWMSDYARPVWDRDQKRVTHIYGAVNDITDQKASTSALENSHRALKTILDAIDATIYVADMQTYEILFMNRYMREAFGRDMTGEICWKVFRNESGPCACCTNAQLVDDQGNPTDEVVVWQDQNPITQQWYINYDRAIQWINQKVARVQIATDITELKAYEAERLQYEQKLRQSQKMEAIGTLAGGIAHDFNNILAAIIGYTELSLADLDPQSNIADNLNEVVRAGSRAKDLVKQILTFARQADEDLQPIMVSSVAKEVIKLLRSTLPATITIEADISSSALVLANVSQIHQIFMNLATNAAQAMEPKGGVLTFTVSEVTWTEDDLEIPVNLSPDRYLKITIADTGKGIAEEVLPLIFEPYFTNKPTGEGTGLGLSVVHGIVKKYGGEVLVSSQLHQGTLFTVYLPIIRKYRPKESWQSDTIPTGHGRILFVDDELSICDMFSQILDRLGYTVTCRTSSVEALGLFKSRPNDFDLVITDMTMPNMTGDILASQLIQIRPEIPIVLCTGYSKSITEKKALEIGIRAFVMKPLVVKDLANIVHRTLNASAAALLNPMK